MKLISMLLGVVLIVTGVLDNIISIVFWVQRHDVFWPFKMKFSLIFPHKKKIQQKKNTRGGNMSQDSFIRFDLMRIK